MGQRLKKCIHYIRDVSWHQTDTTVSISKTLYSLSFLKLKKNLCISCKRKNALHAPEQVNTLFFWTIKHTCLISTVWFCSLEDDFTIVNYQKGSCRNFGTAYIFALIFIQVFSVSIQYLLIVGCHLRKSFFSPMEWSWIWFHYYRDLLYSSEVRFASVLYITQKQQQKNLWIIHFLKCDGLLVHPQASVLERSRLVLRPHIFCPTQRVSKDEAVRHGGWNCKSSKADHSNRNEHNLSFTLGWKQSQSLSGKVHGCIKQASQLRTL